VLGEGRGQGPAGAADERGAEETLRIVGEGGIRGNDRVETVASRLWVATGRQCLYDPVVHPEPTG